LEPYFAVCDYNIVTDDFEVFVAELLSHFPQGFILVMERWYGALDGSSQRCQKIVETI